MEGVFENLYISDREKFHFKKTSEIVHFQTGFNFLNEHKGFRPKCFHTLIAPTGVGKSTLVQSIISNISKSESDGVGGDIVYYSSEEDTEQLKYKFSETNARMGFLKNMKVFCEKERNDITRETFLEMVAYYRPKILIFDNLTTSDLVNCSLAEQSNFLSNVHRVIRETNTSLFLICHAGKGVRTRNVMFDINEIRGTSYPVNKSEFIYTLQSLRVKDKNFTILHLSKSRFYAKENEYFLLNFDKRTRLFASDKPLTHEQVDDIKASINNSMKKSKEELDYSLRNI